MTTDDPFAEWAPEAYENEIEREERRNPCACITCTVTVEGAACFGCGHIHTPIEGSAR